MSSLTSAALNFVVVLLILIFHCNNIVYGDEQQESCSTKCGVHNISHPFRLKDSPKKCGDKRYILSCEENDQLILYYFGKYYVQSINYNNFTIRLLDFNNLGYSNYSLPPHPLGLYNFTSKSDQPIGMPYQVYGDQDISLVKSILYVRCPNSVQNSSDIYFDEGGACMNITHENLFYVNYRFGSDKSLSKLDLGDLGDGCRVEFMYLTSWPLEHGGRRGNNNNNISCSDIRHMMFYGFELSWFNSLCKDGWYWYRYLDKSSHRSCASIGNLLERFSVYCFSLFVSCRLL
jgi:hypothetical protein